MKFFPTKYTGCHAKICNIIYSSHAKYVAVLSFRNPNNFPKNFINHGNYERQVKKNKTFALLFRLVYALHLAETLKVLNVQTLLPSKVL